MPRTKGTTLFGPALTVSPGRGHQCCEKAIWLLAVGAFHWCQRSARSQSPEVDTEPAGGKFHCCRQCTPLVMGRAWAGMGMGMGKAWAWGTGGGGAKQGQDQRWPPVLHPNLHIRPSGLAQRSSYLHQNSLQRLEETLGRPALFPGTSPSSEESPMAAAMPIECTNSC